jgi:hypothetical protein
MVIDASKSHRSPQAGLKFDSENQPGVSTRCVQMRPKRMPRSVQADVLRLVKIEALACRLSQHSGVLSVSAGFYCLIENCIHL